jgi:hypothetical protein
MEKLRRFDLSVLAWWLAMAGTVLLMASTVEPVEVIPQLVVTGSGLWALGGLAYLCGVLLLRSGRRHGS